MKLLLAFFLLLSPLSAQTKVTFGTNWLAQGEHGGFYQALSDGTYQKHGLDVTIIQGGLQVNNRLALTTGKLDFYLGGNLIQAFSALEQGVPTRVAAAIFDKDPQAILTHPHIEKLDQLKDLTLFVSKIGQVTFYPYLKAKFGLDETRIKPYSFNPAPFLADKNSAMQAYITSEPFAIEKAAGFKPKAFLLADHGFSSPSNLIEVRENHDPLVIDKFVKASIEGWHTFLYGDNSAGITALKRENAEMSDDKITYAIAKMKELLVNKETLGSLNDTQIIKFYQTLVETGVMKTGLNPLNIKVMPK